LQSDRLLLDRAGVVGRSFFCALAFVLACTATASAPGRANPPARVEGVARALDFAVVIDDLSGACGSGTLIDPAAGLVLTSLRVVENMDAPRVTFADGACFDGEVVEIDRKLDLALLEIPPQTRAAPVFAEARQPGEELYAIGAPRHLAFSVTRGIVSYVDRAFAGLTLLQVDLTAHPGSTGAPVVNAHGELIGVLLRALDDAQRLSFALPVRYARERFHLRR
jgi:S1-C subfamily serine protease